MRDDILRETMARAIRGEPGAADSWARFQLRQQRSKRFRNLLVGIIGLGAALTLVVVLPAGLGEGPVTDVPALGSNEPRTRLVNRYEDPRAGFAMRYPVDWIARGAPGEPVEFFLTVPDAQTVPMADLSPGEAVCVGACGGADDYVPITEKPRAFFVEVTPIDPPCASRLARCASRRAVLEQRAATFDEQRLAGLQQHGVELATEAASVGPVLAARYAFSYPPEPAAIDGEPLRYWCSGCRLDEFVIDWYEGWKLDIRVMAPSSESFGASIEIALRILESLEPFDG
jgi:hypothetical protein